MFPLEQLSPLRGNRMGGGLGRINDKYQNFKSLRDQTFKTSYHKFRRLSHVKSRSFSTWNAAYQGNLVNTTDSGISLPSHLNCIPNLATAFNPFRQK